MKERRWELDLIRILACFFVVVIHVVASSKSFTDLRTMTWCCMNLVGIVIKSAVPLFFMISGVLFLQKKLSWKTLYQKYVLRIVAAMVIWGIFYAVFDSIGYMKTGMFSARYFVLRVLSGHYHLWFLPAILGVYLCLPILQSLIECLEEKQILPFAVGGDPSVHNWKGNHGSYYAKFLEYCSMG